MRLVSAIVLTGLLAACASSRPMTLEPGVKQKLTVECTVSNSEPNGCTTEHTLTIVATLAPDRSLPSISDLQPPGAGESEF